MPSQIEEERIHLLIEKVADIAVGRAVAKFEGVVHPRKDCLLEWVNILAPLSKRLDSIDHRMSNIEDSLQKSETHESRIKDLERFDIKSLIARVDAIELLGKKISWGISLMWAIIFGGGGIVILNIIAFFYKLTHP